MSHQRDEMNPHDKAEDLAKENVSKENVDGGSAAGKGGCESSCLSDGTPKSKPWSLLARIASLPVYFYRYLISPLIPPRCRFQPTCSEYALIALQRHGALKGGWLALRRIGRCHPWGGSGFDPVPGGSNCDHNHQKRHKQVDKQG